MTELKPGWNQVKFGDVVRLSKARSANPEADGIERYVGLEHIDPENLRIRRWGLVAEGTTFTTRFKPGQVLFGKRRAYQRKVAVADFEGICSGDIYVLESADQSVLLPELLPFICQTDRFFEYAVGTSAGSLSPRTNWNSLSSFRFTLPPLEDQKKIARVMIKQKEVCEAYNEAIESAQRLEKSWLRDQLEQAAEKFPMTKASEVLEHLTVGIVVKPANWYVEPPNGVPALRSINVHPYRLNFSDLVHISLEGHSIHEKSQLYSGDVVVVRSGRPGDAAVIPNDIGLLNCIDLIVARPKPVLLSQYLVAVLNSPFGRKQFAKGIAGTAQQHFNVGLFKHLGLPLPPLQEQETFIANYAGISSAFNELLLQQENNKSLYRTMLQSMFC